MSYYRFNNLAKLLNIEVAVKMGQEIFYIDLMDRECNCYLKSKVNGKCVYKGKLRQCFKIYKVKCSMCEAIYIGSTQQTFKKIIDSHFSNLLSLLKNGKKSDSFPDHSEQHFNATTSHTDLRKYIKFKVVKWINLIGEMKTFTKPNCNLCMEERLTILKIYVTNMSR